MKKSPTSQSDGILGLIREAIDGLGDLVGQHLHLARLELVTDLRFMGRRAQRSLICGVIAILGYTFALAGLAVLLGGNRPIGSWLLLFGGLHLLGAATVFLIGRSRDSGRKLMDTNLEQVGESLATLHRAVSGPTAESNAAPALLSPATKAVSLPASSPPSSPPSHSGASPASSPSPSTTTKVVKFVEHAQRPVAPAQGGPGR